MIPLRDSVRRRHTPFVTWGLILINIWVFLQQIQMTQLEFLQFMIRYSLIPVAVFNPSLDVGGGLLTFVTSLFLHGGVGHLLGNMWILWLFGDNVEDQMGPLPFLLFYILAGVMAGGIHVLSNPASQVPTVGASGAIAGVMAAYLFLYPLARVLTLIPIFIFPYFIALPSFIFIGIWFLSQVFYGTVALAAPDQYGGVAWWAHIGGFVFGAVAYKYFVRRPRRYYGGGL